MWKILWSLAVCLAVVAKGYGEDFEAPKFTAGQGINQVDGWSSEGSVMVSPDQSADGAQSLQVGAGGKVSKALLTSGIRFIDVAVLPIFSSTDQPGETINLGGAKLSFVNSGTGGQIVVVSGTAAQAVNASYKLGDGNLAWDWVKVTVREDVAKGTWDLFLDGKPVVFDQALEADRSSFRVENDSVSAAYVDMFTEQSTNPLFQDTDKDGMPDAYEVANGLNPYLDDRLGDLDNDGISNIQELFTNSSPGVAGSGRQYGCILYVDNKNGNDSNAGTSSYRVEEDGPKASIKSAMAAAKSGDLIMVLPGNGLYQEGSRSAQGKRITIKTLSNVTIK